MRARVALMGAGLALGVAALLGATVCLTTTGCSTLGYYSQSVNGHLALLHSARPVKQWLSDPATPEELRQQLALSQRIRNFAITDLGLPDNSSYRAYADLRRSAAVWNVVAAPELSLRLKTWCFPLLGCVGYRGYYDRAAADALARKLREQGLEVAVYGVPAYSTLGYVEWYAGDPLLSTFIQSSESELARLLFHELAHQVVYASNDTMFNESFATMVERIGVRRWLAAYGSDQARAEFEHTEERRRRFRELSGRTRRALDALYGSDASVAAKRAGKVRLMKQLRADFAALKEQAPEEFAVYDSWIQSANNASLGVLAAYHQLVPAFERLFEREGGDFTRFYAEVRRLARLPRADRHAALAEMSTVAASRGGDPTGTSRGEAADR